MYCRCLLLFFALSMLTACASNRQAAGGGAESPPASIRAAGPEVRIYDIRDLLIPRAPSEPSFDLYAALSSTNSGGANRQPENRLIRYLRKTPRRIAIAHTISHITQTVATPDAWGDRASDAPNTIRELNGNLIIRTTRARHAEVLSLLSSMREERGVRPRSQELLLPDPDGFDIGREPPAEAGSAGAE